MRVRACGKCSCETLNVLEVDENIEKLLRSWAENLSERWRWKSPTEVENNEWKTDGILWRSAEI